MPHLTLHFALGCSVQDPHNRIFRKLLGLFLFIYILWFFYHFVRAVQKVKVMKSRQLFFFYLTCIAIVLSIFALVTGALYPLPTGSIGYSTMYGGMNVYVWILAWCEAPREGASARQTEENDGDDVTALADADARL